MIVDRDVLESEYSRAREEAGDGGGEDSFLDKLLSYRPQWLSKEVHVTQPENETAAAVAMLHQGGRRMLLISYEQAEVLSLPVGHPLEKTVYVGDPASPEVYYPAAMFHAKTFEHNFLRRFCCSWRSARQVSP